MAVNEIGRTVQSQRTVAPVMVGVAPVAVGLQGSTELDDILKDLIRDTPAEASVRERTLTKSWGAKEREFSAPEGCISTQSGESQTVLTWQTSHDGPRKCVTVSKETTKRPSSGAFPPQTGSGHHQQDALPVRFTDDRSLLDAVDARRFHGPPSYQESRTLQTHSETKTRERVLSPVFRRPVQTDHTGVPPTVPSRRRVFSPEIMSDGTVLSRSDYSPSQSYSLPQKRSVACYRNYASDSEEALTWLEEQRRKLEQKRAERTMNYRQQHFVGDRSKSSTDFTRSCGGSYSRRPVYTQSDTDDFANPKTHVPLKNSLSADGLNRRTGKIPWYSQTLEPPRFTKDYGDITRFKTVENRSGKLVENRLRSDVVDNRSRDERFYYVSSIQRPSSATPHTKYSFTMPGLASHDYPGRRAQPGLSAPTSPVIPVRGGSSREAVLRSRGKAREWFGLTEDATYNRLDDVQQQLRKPSEVRLSSPLKPTPTETELISLLPIGRGVQDLEPDGTVDGTLNFTGSTPTLNPTVQDYTQKRHERLRSHSSLGRATQVVSPSTQRRDLGYATMPISRGDPVGFAPLPRPFTSLGPAPPSDELGNYQGQRRIYSSEAVQSSLSGSGQTGYDVQRPGQVWSSAGQQALSQQWIQQQPLSQQQQVHQQEFQYRQEVQQQQQLQRQQEQQRQLQLQEQRQLQQEQEQQRQLQLQEQQRQLQQQQEQQRQLQLQEQQMQLQQQQEQQRQLQLQEQQRQMQQQQEQQRQLQLQEQQRQLQQQQEQQRQLQLQEQQRQLQQQQEQQRQLQLQEQQRQLQQQQEQQRQLQLQEQQRQLQQHQEQQRQLQQQQQYQAQMQTIQRTYIVEEKTAPRRPLASQTMDSQIRETSFASAQPVSQFTRQEAFRESSFAEPHRSTRADAAVQVDNARWNDAGSGTAANQYASVQRSVQGGMGAHQFGAQMTEGCGVVTNQVAGQAGVSQTGGQVVEQRYAVERQVVGTSQGNDQVGMNQMGRQVGISQYGGQVGVQPTGGQVGINQVGIQAVEQRYVVERQVVGANQAGQQVGVNQLAGQVGVGQVGGQLAEAQAVGTGQEVYRTASHGGTQSSTQQASHQHAYTHQTGTAERQNTWQQSTGTRHGTQEERYGQQASTAYRQQQGVRFGGNEADTSWENRVLSSPRASQRVEVMSTERGEQQHQQLQQLQQLQQQQQSYAYGFQQVGERSDGADWMQQGGMNDGRSASASYPIHPGGSWTLRPEVTSRSGGHQRNASASFVERYSSPRYGLGRARTNSATCVTDGSEWSHQPLRFVRDTSKFWHKPNISRDDAINLLLDKEPGSFVVRNSSTFPGSFGLALKVSQVPPNMQTKGGDPQVDLIRHFLIEPTPKGVRLKGCSTEPVFASLAALIYQHSITPLSLPCKLKLPDEDIGGSDALDGSVTLSGSNSILQGAACTVFYISSVGTENLTGPEALSRSIKELLESGRPLPRTTIVQFKATRDGITLTDNRRRIFFRRFYPIQTVTFCGTDPRERRWTVKSEDLTISGKAFGFVARKPGVARENACHVFLELDPTQPASVIVNFVSKILIGQGPRLLQQ